MQEEHREMDRPGDGGAPRPWRWSYESRRHTHVPPGVRMGRCGGEIIGVKISEIRKRCPSLSLAVNGGGTHFPPLTARDREGRLTTRICTEQKRHVLGAAPPLNLTLMGEEISLPSAGWRSMALLLSVSEAKPRSVGRSRGLS